MGELAQPDFAQTEVASAERIGEDDDIEGDDRALATSLAHHDIAATAEAGVAGAATPLPHADAIQSSFGEHDVSGVRANVGGEAATASDALGAEAYASGDAIAFAAAPDLHTAAHEAAHVVQNRTNAAAGPLGANGALTSPGDAREQHADAVADRVVRGESAAALLTAAPAGAGAIARKATGPKLPDGEPAAFAEAEAMFAAGHKLDATRLAMLAPMLTWEHKVAIRDAHWADLEKAVTPTQLITIGRIIGHTTAEIVKAVLRKGATARELGHVVNELDESDLIDLASDAAVLAQLRAALPGPVVAHITALRMLTDAVVGSAPLMHWLVDTSSPIALWRQIRGVTDKSAVAASFDAEKLWAFLGQVPASALTIDDDFPLRGLLAATADNVAKGRLEALRATLPKAPEPLPADASQADIDARTRENAVVRLGAIGELTTLLAGEKPLDPANVLATSANAMGAPLTSDAHARRRVLATLDADQLETFTSNVGFPIPDKVDWLLAARGVGPEHFIQAIAFASDADVAAIFGHPGHVARLHKLLGDAPSALPDLKIAPIQKIALANTELRTWLLGAASPQEILEFVTIGPTAESIAAACKVIAADHGYDWAYQLTVSGADSSAIRRLALAIPDRAAAKHLLQYNTEDRPVASGDVVDRVAAPSTEATRSTADELRDEAKRGDGDELAHDAAELSDADRAAVQADKKLVAQTVATTATGNDAFYGTVRAARELDGNLSDTVRACASGHTVERASFRTYARERPDAEHIAVASNPALATAAEDLLRYSPFNALPGLATAAALESVLRANPAFVGWIERTTSPTEAIVRLGANPTLAEVAAGALEAHGVGIVVHLPHSGLTTEQRMALAQLASNAKHKKLFDAASDKLTDNAAADADQPKASHHRHPHPEREPLPVVLDRLASANADAAAIQAACNEHAPSEALALLADPATNRQRIAMLQGLGVSPLTIFPGIAAASAAQLFTDVVVTDWILQTEEAVAALRRMAGAPHAIALAALGVATRHIGATHWLGALPMGFGLSRVDEEVLFAVYQNLPNLDDAKRVFMTRFGTLPEGQWTRDQLDQLWTTLAKLPDKHVLHNTRLGGFNEIERSDRSDIGGFYGGDGVIAIAGDPAGSKRYDDASWQSREQLAASLGITPAEVDARVGKSIETNQLAGATVYRIKAIDGHGFTDTVLHEMGHAVDAMLGSRTELVYGMAGWKSYGGGDFDAWATDMNAWDGATVGAGDRAEIRMLFEQRLRSSNAITGPSDAFSDLATKEHPIKTTHAFVGKAVAKPNSFEYYAPIEHGGRRYLMNHYYGRFYSYDERIHDILPLPYAGFAPEEFFAECYVEYYRDEQVPGGNLPAWIKTWFDANIDREGHRPAEHA